MKPRVVSTYKILAVAITAGVGCRHPAPRGEEAGPTTASAASVPSAVAPEAPHASSGIPPSADPHAPPPADDKVDPKLLALRERLAEAGREKALADEKTFRPLCDADGYPLVGNLARKSPKGPFGPSELCAELRAKKRS
ncbi:MAG: hypothetical protein JST00_21340 [Deltaproteobacteria bacterium]|nr:hypothetical protein [Deltaproteobacteria bacterium]